MKENKLSEGFGSVRAALNVFCCTGYFEVSLFKLQSHNSAVGIKSLVTEVQINVQSVNAADRATGKADMRLVFCRQVADNCPNFCSHVLDNIACDTDGIMKLAEATRLGSLHRRLLAKQMKRAYCIKVIIEALLSLTCFIN